MIPSKSKRSFCDVLSVFSRSERAPDGRRKSACGAVGALALAAALALSLSAGASAQTRSVSIAALDDSLLEGANGGPGRVRFELTLTLPAGESLTSDLTVSYTILATGDTASEADISTALSGTQTFQTGMGNGATRRVTVRANSDSVLEDDETFTVTLSNPTGGVSGGVTLGTTTATATIVDATEAVVAFADPPQGAETFIAFDGDPVTFVLTLVDSAGDSVTTAKDIVVGYETVTGSGADAAEEDIHFTPAMGTVTISPTEQMPEIAIDTEYSDASEGTLTFTLRLTEPSGGFPDRVSLASDPTATGSIWDFSDLSLEFVRPGLEGDRVAFRMELDPKPLLMDLQVPYAISFESHENPASQSDFGSFPLSGTFTFPAGQTEAIVEVPTTRDDAAEGEETFTLALTAPDGGFPNSVILRGLIDQATGTIWDADTPILAGPAATDGIVVAEDRPIGFGISEPLISAGFAAATTEAPTVWSITTPGVPFGIDRATGQLFVTQDLDLARDDESGASRPYVLTIQLTQGGDTATRQVTITVVNVNDPPSAPVLRDQTAIVGSSFTYQFAEVTDPENNAVTYSAASSGGGALPGWLQFNAATRTFSGTPAASDVGNVNLRVTATESAGSSPLSSDTQFAIGVVAANTPTLIASGAYTVPEDAAVDAPVGAALTTSGFTGSGGTWSITAGNHGTAFAIDSGTGQLSVAAALDHEARSFFRLTVQFVQGTVTRTRDVVVSVSDVNEEPVAQGTITPVVATAGAGPVVRDISGNFVEPDGHPLRYTAESSDESVATVEMLGIDGSSEGTLVIVPLAAGTATISVEASDERELTSQGGLRFFARGSFTVTVVADDTCTPASGDTGICLDSPNDLAFTVDTPVSVALPLATGGTPPYAYGIEDASGTEVSGGMNVVPGMSLDTGTGVLSGTPTAAQAQTAFTYVATDATSTGRAARAFAITVKAAPTNAAPMATEMIDAIMLDLNDAPQGVDVSGNFRDPDSDALTYTAVSGDEGVASVSVSGSTVTITPVAAGVVTITVTARDGDGQGLFAQQTINVAVAGDIAVAINAGITGDDIINIAEKAAPFAITGTTTTGATVSVTVGAGAAHSASVSGRTWTVTIPADLPEITGTAVEVVATASLGGETAMGRRDLTVDLVAPAASWTPPASLAVGAQVSVAPSGASMDIARYSTQSAAPLPPGLTLDINTGVISGAPTAVNADTTDVTIGLTDNSGNTADVPITFPAVGRGNQVLSNFRYTPDSVRRDQEPPAVTPPTGAQADSALSYSAAPSTICTVDSGTGALTLVGEGVCTITATATQTDSYDMATATTTVTITSEPSLTGAVPITVARSTAANTEIGSPLTPVNFPSGTAMWSITDGNADGVFAIDSGTGQLSTAQALDSDTVANSYTLTVRLEQGDGVATARVAIILTSINALSVTIAEGIAGDDIVNIAEKAAGFDITGTTEAGASVIVAIDGGRERNATVTDTDWTVSIPAGDSEITGTSLTVTATATMSGSPAGTAVRMLAVDLEAPTAAYAAPASLTVGEAIATINPGGPSADVETYSVSSGNLPPGLALDPDTGAIAGTPTTANASTAAVAIGLTDNNGNPGNDIDITFPAVDLGVQTLTGFAYAPNMLRFDERTSRPPVLNPPTAATPTGDAAGAVTYSAEPSTVCTVDPNTGALTLTGAGTCTVTATAAQTANYNAASAMAEVRVDALTMSLSPDAVEVVEGETASFTVTVSASPEIAVTVAYTLALDGANPAAASDFTSFQADGTVTFDPGATELTQTIAIETADDNDEEPGDPETFTVSLAAPVGGFMAGVELLSSSETATGSILDNDTATVSVDLDAEAEEGNAARFTARLSNPFKEDITLAWTTVDPLDSAANAADPGSDYVRMSGLLTFPAGTTEQTFEVPTLRDDDTEEGDEILTVRLEAPAGSSLPQGVTLAPNAMMAMATIRDGAAAAPGARLSRVNAAVLPRVAQAMVASTLEAIVGRIDSAAPDGQASSLPGKSSVIAALESGARSSGGAEPDLERTLSGSSFVLALNAAEERGRDGVGPVSVWGGGDYRRLSGPEDGAIDWDGDMFGFVLGADMRLRPDLLAGLSVSRHSGSFDYTDRAMAGAADGAASGELDSRMTAVHPYVSWSPAGGPGLWATAGYGEGEVETGAGDGEARHKSDTRFRMAAAGASYALLSNDDWIAGGATTLRIKGQGSAAKLTVDGKDPVPSDSFDIRTLRLALEGRYDCQPDASGGCLSPSLEIAGRHDSGDGRTGTGIELGGGLRYANRAAGLTVEGRGRALLTGGDDGEDWGVGGQVLFVPGGDRLGLSVRLSPSFGDTASKVERLYGPDSSSLATASGERPSGRIATEVGYGFAGDAGFGVATPYAGVSLAEEGVRQYRTGIRFEAGPTLRIGLEGEVEERAVGAANRQITLRGRLAW